MKSTLTVVFLLGMIRLFGAKATPDSLKGPVRVLDAIRLVATSSRTSVGDITLRKIELAAPEPNVAAVVDDIAGASITEGAKGESNIHIRGFDKHEIKVMVDGRPLAVGYMGNLDLHLLTLSDLEEVQVVKGPVSPVYGFNAMGGVVNIVTRKPDNKSWLKVGSQVRRNDTERVYLSSGRVLGDFDYWLFASRDHTGGFMLPADMNPVSPQIALRDKGGERNNAFRTEYNLQGRTNYNLGFMQIGASGGHAWIDEKANPYSIYPSPDEKLSRLKDWQRSNATLDLSAPLNGRLSLLGSLYYDYYEDTYLTYPNTTFTTPRDSSVIRNYSSGQWMQLEFLFPFSRMTLGERIEYQAYKRHGGSGYENGWTANHFQLSHVFLQGEFGLHKPLGGTVSSALSRMRLEGRDRDDLHWEPAAGVFWKPGRVTLNLGYSRNTRYPSMRQLYSASSGNPDLLPEVADKAELDAEWRFAWGERTFALSQAIFLNRVRDMIDQSGGDYHNIDKMLSHGSESAMTALLEPWWTSSGSFSFLKSDQGYGGHKLYDEPAFSAKLNNQFQLPWKLALNVSANWMDSRASLDGYDREQTLPAFWLFGMKVQRSWERIKLSFAVENILDTYYEQEYGYPGPGVDFCLSCEAIVF